MHPTKTSHPRLLFLTAVRYLTIIAVIALLALTISARPPVLASSAPPASGLQLWLDANDPDGDGSSANNPANGALLNTWTDKSGQNHNATVFAGKNAGAYTTSVINGLPVVNFARVDSTQGSVYEVSGLDLRAATMPDATIFTVYRPNNPNASAALWGIDDGNWDRFFYVQRGSATDDGMVGLGPVQMNANVPNAGLAGTVRLLAVVYDGNVTGGVNSGPVNGSAVYFDGNLQMAFTDSSAPTAAQTTFRLGWDGDDRPYSGDVAEVLVYDRVLNNDELTQVNNYLSGKYSVVFADTVAPNAPVVTTPATSPVVTTARPTFSGTAEEQATVTVAEGGSTICTATAAANTSWSCTPSADLSQGAHSVSVTATDAASNVSSATTRSFSIDSLAPSAPTSAPDLDAASDSGTSATDDITSDSTPTFSGTGGTAGDIVNLYEGATLRGTATVQADGSWSVTVSSALSDASHSLTVRFVDAAGNESGDSPTLSVLVDTSAPNAPTSAPDLDAASDTGTSATDDITSDSTPTFSGTGGTAGNVVNLYEVTTLRGTATVQADGSWSVTVSSALSDASHVMSVRFADAAGNESGDSPTLSVLIDTSAPNAPTSAPDLDAASDSGTSATDDTTSDSTPTFSGTAGTAGNVVNLYEGTTLRGTATVQAGGSWSMTVTSALSDASHSLTVRFADAAGNESGDSPTLSVLVDTSVPSAPISAPDLDAASDTGTSATDDITSDSTPTFSGTGGTAGEVVNLYEGTTLRGTATVQADGSWSVTVTSALSDASHSLTVRFQDAAGNESGDSPTLSVLVDTSAPSAPAVSTPANGNPVNVARPSFSGTLPTGEAGGTVELHDGALLVCSAVVQANGSWGCQASSDLSAGDHTIATALIDLAGNSSPAGSHTITIDLSSPSVPTVDSPEDGAHLNVARPTFSGSVAASEAGGTVSVREGATTHCTAVVQNDGSWSCAASADMATGDYTLSVTVTDQANNTSQPSILSISVDLEIPAAVTSFTPASGNTTGGRPVFGGNLPVDEIGGTVTVRENGNVICTAEVTAPDGDWICQPAVVLSNGPHSVTVVLKDLAGNESSTTTRAFDVDTTIPNSPTISSRPATNDRTPTFAGNAEPNSTVTVTIDLDNDGSPDVTYTTTAAADGSWSIDTANDTPASGVMPVDGLAAGSYPVSVTVTNKFGYSSSPTQQVLQIDVSSPQPPVVPATPTTNDPTPVLSGTAEPGSTVTVSIDFDGDEVADVVFQTVAGGDGTWTINTGVMTPVSGQLPATGLADGTYGMTTTTTDPAGNISAAVTSALSIDTAQPSVPTVTSPAPGAPVSGSPVLAGTAEPNSIVEVTVDQDGNPATTADVVVYRTTTDASGHWSIDTATAVPSSGSWGAGLIEGAAPMIGVMATDPAGNVSGSTSLVPVVDTTAPVAPVLNALPERLSDRTPVLSGHGEPGATAIIQVDLNDDGVPEATYEVTIDLNGAWSLDFETSTPVSGALPGGKLPMAQPVTFGVVVRDKAGNLGQMATLVVEVRTFIYAPMVFHQALLVSQMFERTSRLTISYENVG